MKETPKISEAEWQIMRVLWSSASSTANDIIEALEETTDWSPKTIRTMLNRLVQKQVIAYRQGNRNYEYYPLVSQEDSVKQETQSFFKRIFGMGRSPSLVHFLREENLSKEEIEELKKILDEKKPM